MITVNGTLDSLAAVPEAREGETSGVVPLTGEPPKMAQVIVTATEGMSTGSVTLVVPVMATGGLAVGPCRIMVENA
jgi:hypothetical protein